jgi:DNA gyrase/topoisomerase IV subunit B
MSVYFFRGILRKGLGVTTVNYKTIRNVGNYDYDELYEHVRARPGMYFGTTSLRGLHFAILELIIYCFNNDKTEIYLTVHGSNITLSFEGEKPKNEFMLNLIQAACCSFVYADGKYKFSFDKEVFENTEPNKDVLFDTLRELAFLNKKASIIFNEHVFHYEDGVIDLFKYLQVKLGSSFLKMCTPAGFYAENDNMSVDVAFAPAGSPHDTCVFSYVNDKRTEENGTHVDGFIKGLKSSLIDYTQHYDGHINSFDSVGVGLVIHVRTTNAQYGGATKRHFISPEVQSFVKFETENNLKRIFTDNPQMACEFIKYWLCTSIKRIPPL